MACEVRLCSLPKPVLERDSVERQRGMETSLQCVVDLDNDPATGPTGHV